MNEIVDRLLDTKNEYLGLRPEAAFEIERLTAENERLRALDSVIQAHAEIIGDQDDEIKVLRAALVRLCSSETFTLPFAIDKDSNSGRELVARIDYARTVYPQLSVNSEEK